MTDQDFSGLEGRFVRYINSKFGFSFDKSFTSENKLEWNPSEDDVDEECCVILGIDIRTYMLPWLIVN